MISAIQDVVARHYGFSVPELLCERRFVEVARPRQIAMYLAKHLTTRSLPIIGRQFDRDHSTVFYAVKRIAALRIKDEALDYTIADLSRRIIAQQQHELNDALIGWAA